MRGFLFARGVKEMLKRRVKNKGLINPNILIIMFIMPMLLMLLLNANLNILSSAAQFKSRVNHYHSLSSSISKATQCLQHDLPLGVPERIPEAEISINGLDIQYVAIIPIEQDSESAICDIVAIARDDSLIALKKEVEVQFFSESEEHYSVQVISEGFTDPQSLIDQYNLPIER
jgi:hypothetical protein